MLVSKSGAERVKETVNVMIWREEVPYKIFCFLSEHSQFDFWFWSRLERRKKNPRMIKRWRAFDPSNEKQITVEKAVGKVCEEPQL